MYSVFKRTIMTFGYPVSRLCSITRQAIYILWFNYTLHKFYGKGVVVGLAVVITQPAIFIYHLHLPFHSFPNHSTPPVIFCCPLSKGIDYVEPYLSCNERDAVDDHVQQIKQIKIPIFHYQIIFYSAIKAYGGIVEPKTTISGFNAVPASIK